MLSVAKLSGNLDYYLQLATLGYYQNGGEPIGKWFGTGASMLNLKGEIDETVINRISAGYSADGSTKLVQNAGKEDRQIGWDLTFSAPKSVSVLWSVASPEIRHEIKSAQDEAVKATVGYLEETSGISRVGKAGSERTPVGLVVGLFEHGSSRANDPQLHTHALVLNVGVDSERKTRSIVSKPFFQKKITAGALYRTELAHQLATRLGVRLEQDKFSFQIKGVPEALCQFHSKRRKEVLGALRAAGQTSSRAAQIATLETRNAKETIPRSELFRKWEGEAAQYGFTQRNVNRLIGRRKVRQTPKKSVEQAFEKLASQHSYFSKSEILRETANLTQAQGVSIAQVRKVVDQFLANEKVVCRLSDLYFTSVENIRNEEALVKAATQLSKSIKKPVKIKSLESKLTARSQMPLNWEQAAALAHITLNDSSISLVSGKAGTGKTRMLKVAADLWKDAGYDVLGVCVAGKAARGLHDATGIRTETLAKLLYDSDPNKRRPRSRNYRKQLNRTVAAANKPLKLTKKTVLVVDEAGMLGTQDLRRVFELVQKSKAKIVLVGDGKQLQPITPGNPFQSLVNQLGAVQLDEVVRQHSDFDKQMVQDLSNGMVQSALLNLAERDLVHCAEDRASAIKQLVTDWAAFQDPSNLILVPSRAEASEVNRQCQRVRQQRGAVKNGMGLKINGVVVQVGDRIQFGRKDRGLRLENGDFATIERVNVLQKTLTARLDSGQKVLVPVQRYDAINLGYATTVHKGQGATVERAFVLLGGHMQDSHLSYVQLSRARAETRVYLDRVEAGDNYSELLAKMGRDKQRNLAIDLAKIDEALTQSI